MSSIDFSLIVPIYNAEVYLSKCLTSLINQTYKNFEIILINDGSKDGSLKIAQKFANENDRIKIIDQKNAGVSTARNVGLATATGKYVIFIDSDDYLIDMRAIEKLHAATNKRTDVVMYNIFYENKSVHYPLLEKSYIDKREFDAFLFQMIRYEHLNSPCNKVYNRQILNKYKIQFDNNIKIGEDLLFNIEYFKYCQSAYYLNDTLYFYRTSNVSSATSSYMKDKYIDLMLVNDVMHVWMESRVNNKLTNVARFIRMKNILSCLRDISHPASLLNEKEKQEIIVRYKINNPRIIVRYCGLKIYVASLIYSMIRITLLSRIINKLYGEKI